MMFNFRKFPLLLCTIALFIGGILQFLLSLSPANVLVFGSVGCLLILLALQKRSLLSDTFHLRIFFAFQFFAALGMVLFCANDFRFQSDSITRLHNQNATFVGVVTESKNVAAEKQSVVTTIQYIKKNDSLQPCSGKVILQLVDVQTELNEMDEIVFHGKILPIVTKGNPGEFNAPYYYQSKRIAGTVFLSPNQISQIGTEWSISGFFAQQRKKLARAMEDHLDGVFLGIAQALILGDKGNLDQDTTRVFSNTGSMHVLAVSGLHIGLLLVMIRTILQLFARFISKRQALILSLVFIWVYGLISGASPSVMRAVVMFSFIAAAELLHRKNQAMNGLLISAMVLFAYDPWVIFDIGFQLSYAAMIGIFVLYQPLTDLLHFKNQPIQKVWEGTAVGLAATITTFPLTLFWFYQFPNYFLIANLGVMLFGFLVLLFGMIFLFTSWIPYLVKIVAFVFSLTIIGLVAWVAWIDQLTGAVSGGFHWNGWHVAAAYALILLWLNVIYLKRKWSSVVAVCSLIFIGVVSFQRSEVLQKEQLTILRTKQLALVLQTKDGAVGFYDVKNQNSLEVPRELVGFAQYSGQKTQFIALEHDTTRVAVAGNLLRIFRVKEGFGIELNSQQWFYRMKGIPEKGDNPRLMSLGLQSYLFPEKTFEVFTYQLRKG